MTNRQLSLLEQVRELDPRLSDEQAVVRACEQIVDLAEACPPVRVEVIASLRGITRIERREQPWAGMLGPAPTGAGLHVTLRASDSHERQRFTVCHEAGHTLFPGFHQQRQFRCNGTKTRIEQLCDLAASELLLPRRYFESDLADASFHWDSVEALAARYDASIESTANRFVELWPRDRALLMVLRERHKPAERGREEDVPPRLRLDYCHKSGSWPYARRHKSAAESSLLQAALLGDDVSETGILDEFFASSIGPVEVHARRYGIGGRVLALVRPT
jgi:hypothetical protein